MPKTLENFNHLFAASLTQTPVSVWQTDTDGVYVMIGYGFIDKITPQAVRIADSDSGARTSYSRDASMFMAEL